MVERSTTSPLQSYARAAVQANTSLQLLNGIQSVVLNIGLVSVTLLAGMEVLQGRMSLGGSPPAS